METYMGMNKDVFKEYPTLKLDEKLTESIAAYSLLKKIFGDKVGKFTLINESDQNNHNYELDEELDEELDDIFDGALDFNYDDDTSFNDGKDYEKEINKLIKAVKEEGNILSCCRACIYTF